MLLKMDGDSELRRRGGEALRRELLSQYSEPTRQPRKSWGHWAWQQGGGEIETEKIPGFGTWPPASFRRCRC